jgi:hypothetical protein
MFFRSDNECLEFIVNLFVTPLVVIDMSVSELFSKFTDTVKRNSIIFCGLLMGLTFNLAVKVLEDIFVELLLISSSKSSILDISESNELTI